MHFKGSREAMWTISVKKAQMASGSQIVIIIKNIMFRNSIRNS